MAGSEVEDTVAVVGETVVLRFEAEEHFTGDLEISFSVLTLDGPPNDPTRRAVFQTIFKRTLPAQKDPAGTAPGRKVSTASWVVELPVPGLEQRLCLIAFEASGTTEGGRRAKARSLNRLRLPGISVTTAPELQQIMLHEFAKRNGGAFTLDTAPLEQRIKSLTVEQRKLLATYDTKQRAGRLVIFVTFEPTPIRPMFADNCSQTNVSVNANATFSVFACRGKGENVTLACHTDHFVINTRNGDTQSLFGGIQKGKPPNQWLSPNNPSPPRFLCASHANRFTDGVVWSRLFTPNGVDVMPGNSIHGVINTIGCWMLFRNYNWPVSVRTQLFRAYMTRRVDSSVDVTDQLTAAGYDDPSSFNKFIFFDLNYAYNFFFRDVVGIDFFASQSQFYRRFENLHDTHGQVFDKVLDPDKVLKDRFLYHDFVMRKAEEPSFTVQDSLFRENSLGFRTADGFLTDAEWKQNLSRTRVENRSWSDWYFFKSPSLPLRTAVATPVGPGP